MTVGPTETSKQSTLGEPELPTLMDHLQELKGRFFWVAVAFIVASGLAYPRYKDIVNVLTAPMGNQELYYLTPAGGFSFIIKVCMYVGIIAILPVMIYHLYKFITPVMKQQNVKAVLMYTAMSTVLAIVGILFAYFFSLPAALHFLTNVEVGGISSMITIDAYMSFVTAYIAAGAFLFQTPLVMLIINSVSPLKPAKLMSYQRHMIVASFVAAAIISPTPDVVNQTILAAPMVLMYQVGICAVWFRNRNRAASSTDHEHHKAGQVRVYKPSAQEVSDRHQEPIVHEQAPQHSYLFSEAEPTSSLQQQPYMPPEPAIEPVQPAPVVVRSSRSVDGVRLSPRLERPRRAVPQRHVVSQRVINAQISPDQLAASSGQQRTVDGFAIPSL